MNIDPGLILASPKNGSIFLISTMFRLEESTEGQRRKATNDFEGLPRNGYQSHGHTQGKVYFDLLGLKVPLLF